MPKPPKKQKIQPEPQPVAQQQPEMMPQQMSQPEEVSSAESGNTSKADLPDFDGIAQEIGVSEPPLAPALPSGVLTKDQFFSGFGGMFTMASAMTGYKTLAVDQSDPMAREASDAIYDTAAEVEMFHFLIKPGNLYVQRALVVLAFGMPKYQMVMAEVNARRRSKVVQGTSERVPLPADNDNGVDSSSPLSPDFGMGLTPQ